VKYKSLFYYKNLKFSLTASDRGLTHVSLINTDEQIQLNKSCHYIEEAILQLKEYLEGSRSSFNLTLDIQGTEFQKKIWTELLKIPHGSLCSYQEIALTCGGVNYARAVAMACHYNPLMIVIPCHRVVGRQGKLTGYAFGLEIKQHLINLEQRQLSFFPSIIAI
jgi:methylated-DNA-[protein]-cysteine S-methyltransferase